MSLDALEQVGAVSEIAHSVRPSDLDSFGHVNNARVLEYCEFGRWHWVEERFLMGSHEVVPVVSNYAVTYNSEIFIGPLLVKTTLIRSQRYSVMFEHAIFRPSDDPTRPAVVANATVCFLDRTKRRPVRVRDYMAHCAEHAGRLAIQPPVSLNGAALQD
jgi:YbgC/YbaW family acyl-CoA thioester hydrolase